jgi:flavin-binding protein dodecin
VYRVTEVIGTSGTSWEDAAAEAIRTATGTIRDLRVAEVVKQDIHLDEGGRSPTAPSFSSRSNTNASTDPRSASPADRFGAPVPKQPCPPIPGRPLPMRRETPRNTRRSAASECVLNEWLSSRQSELTFSMKALR